jgi:TPR repeat protein
MRGKVLSAHEEHEQLLAREPNLKRLQGAYALLSTDIEKGRSELEELANQGSVLSMLYLATSYKRGPHADQSKVERWYRAAYEKNALNAFSGLGTLYYGQGKYDLAEKIFVDGVSRNDAVSMYWLAKIYIEGPKLREKSDEIKHLLERSAAFGQVRAKNRLAFLLMRGRYGVTSIPRGVFLYFSSVVGGFRIALRDPEDRRLW